MPKNLKITNIWIKKYFRNVLVTNIWILWVADCMIKDIPNTEKKYEKQEEDDNTPRIQ